MIKSSLSAPAPSVLTLSPAPAPAPDRAQSWLAALPGEVEQKPPRRWAIVAIAALTAFLAYMSYRVDLRADSLDRGDFGVYYRAGQDMAARRPLYYSDFGAEEMFKYAPVEALALTAIHWLPPRAARQVWYLTDLLLLAVIYVVSYRMLYPDGRWTSRRGWLAFATFVLTSGYCMNQLTAAQTTTLWVALCMLTVWWITQGRSGRAGLALAAAICVKVVPLCFLPYLAIRGRRAAALPAFAVSLVGLLLLPAAWVGWSNNAQLLVDWSHSMFDALSPKMFFDFRNQSLYAVLFRLLSPTPHHVEIAQLDLATVGRIALVASCLLAVALYGWIRKAARNEQPERREATMLALLLIFMTACNPLGWRQNCVALVFPYFLALDALLRFPRRRGALLALVIPSVLLIYVRGQTLASFPLTYLIQVFGGRFWANAMLAAAALVAYDAANAPGALRIASLDTDERARHGPATETGSGLRAAA